MPMREIHIQHDRSVESTSQEHEVHGHDRYAADESQGHHAVVIGQ